MFSRTRRLTTNLPGTDQKVAVLYPNDEAWLARARKRVTLIKPMGRGRSTTKVLNAQAADLIVCQAAVGEDTQVDEYAATILVEQLSSFEILELETDSSGIVSITAMTPFGEVEHKLQQPTPKQVVKHREFGSSLRDTPNGQEIRMNYSYTGDLYDELKLEVKNYENDEVPVLHKWAVVHAILQNFDSAAQLSEEELF